MEISSYVIKTIHKRFSYYHGIFKEKLIQGNVAMLPYYCWACTCHTKYVHQGSRTHYNCFHQIFIGCVIKKKEENSTWSFQNEFYEFYVCERCAIHIIVFHIKFSHTFCTLARHLYLWKLLNKQWKYKNRRRTISSSFKAFCLCALFSGYYPLSVNVCMCVS